jgi:hypothetical protein
MLGYSEANAIYFTVGEKTGFARIKPNFNDLELRELVENQYQSVIDSGSFIGLPKYNYFNFNKEICEKTKQCHCAEHKTYNAFQKKINQLKKDTKLKEFINYIPSIDEIKSAESFSIFCGTSFVISSSIAIILMCLPNLFQYKNTDYIFMPLWLIFSIAVLFICSRLIQSRYLAEPNLIQLFIAQTALKEVIHGNNNKPNN